MDEDELVTDESKKDEEGKEKEPEVQVTEPEGKQEEAKPIDVEALKKALAEEIAERVRKEEKDKLYKSFEKYKEDASEAKAAQKAAEDKLKEYENSNLSVEEQNTLKMATLAESNEQLKGQMEELVQLANTRINTLELELAKKELLGQYGDEIIPSMISGSTLEEITESAENAHREYLAIRDKEIAKLKETSTKRESVGTGLKPNNDKLNVGHTLADIKKIDDPKEWEKNRDKFLEEARKFGLQ